MKIENSKSKYKISKMKDKDEKFLIVNLEKLK